MQAIYLQALRLLWRRLQGTLPDMQTIERGWDDVAELTHWIKSKW
jgi:hypothetical protein